MLFRSKKALESQAQALDDVAKKYIAESQAQAIASSELKAAEQEYKRLKYATEDYGKEVTNLTRIQRQIGEGGSLSGLPEKTKKSLEEQAQALDEVTKKHIAESQIQKTVTSEMRLAEQEYLRLKYATDDYGKQLTNLDRLQRQFATGGALTNITAQAKAKLEAQARALDDVMKKQVSGFKMGQQQIAALGYQTTDIIKIGRAHV